MKQKHEDDLKENVKAVWQAPGVYNAVTPIVDTCTLTVTIVVYEQYGKLYVDWSSPLPYAVSSNEGIVVETDKGVVASLQVGQNYGRFPTELNYGSQYKVSYVAVNVATNQHCIYCSVTTV